MVTIELTTVTTTTQKTQTLMTQTLTESFAYKAQVGRAIAGAEASQFMQTLKCRGK